MGHNSDRQKALDSRSFGATQDDGLSGAGGDMACATTSGLREANLNPGGDSPPALMGGETLVGVSRSDIENSFIPLSLPEESWNEGTAQAPDQFPSETEVAHNPLNESGFLTRPNGWER